MSDELGVGDWLPPLEPGETVLWSKSNTFGEQWLMLTVGVLSFVSCVWLFGPATQFQGTVAEYCALHHTRRCGMVYALAWPGLIVSAAFGVASIGIGIGVGLAAGWLCKCYVVTNLRAIEVTRMKWRTPPDRVDSVNLEEAILTSGQGYLSFEGPRRLAFIVLRRKDRKKVIDLVNAARNAPNP